MPDATENADTKAKTAERAPVKPATKPARAAKDEPQQDEVHESGVLKAGTEPVGLNGAAHSSPADKNTSAADAIAAGTAHRVNAGHRLAEMRHDRDAIRRAFETGDYPYRQKLRRSVYEKHKAELQVELLKVQEWVKATDEKIVLIFEGRDGAGKGGTIKRFTEHLNPRGARIVALEKPTERERSQWYFQRYIEKLPAGGEIVLFDRSWYNRGGVERVMGFCTPNEYLEFMRQCPDIERMMVRSGIRLYKYWFSVTREEQARRFKAREHEPLKQWKLSPIDRESLSKWDDASGARRRSADRRLQRRRHRPQRAHPGRQPASGQAPLALGAIPGEDGERLSEAVFFVVLAQVAGHVHEPAHHGLEGLHDLVDLLVGLGIGFRLVPVALKVLVARFPLAAFKGRDPDLQSTDFPGKFGIVAGEAGDLVFQGNAVVRDRLAHPAIATLAAKRGGSGFAVEAHQAVVDAAQDVAPGFRVGPIGARAIRTLGERRRSGGQKNGDSHQDAKHGSALCLPRAHSI